MAEYSVNELLLTCVVLLQASGTGLAAGLPMEMAVVTDLIKNHEYIFQVHSFLSLRNSHKNKEVICNMTDIR